MVPETAPPEDAGAADDPASRRAAAKAGGGKAPLKVELDLEDAPFLEEPEEEAPPPEPAPESEKKELPPPKAQEQPQSKLAGLLANKKRLALIGGGALCILLAPVVFLMLASGPKEAPPPPPPEPTRVITPQEPPREPAPAGPKFVFKLEPFFVEIRGTEGEIRFLRCRFSIPTDSQPLFNELRVKTIALRDSIYYYLDNKPLTFLSDQGAREALKQDLISVINEHASADKIHNLYIEEYLITGK